MKSTRHELALLRTILGFEAAILDIEMFDLFQILVAKTYENVSSQLEIVTAKTGGHIKIGELVVRLVFS